MARALVHAAALAAFLLLPDVAAAQAGRLSVTVTLGDAAGASNPVQRHALLISDTPPSMPPQRMVTGLDGTGGINLVPGRYIVESENPVAFEGQAYRWIQPVDVAAGADVSLTLSAENARVEPLADAPDATDIVVGDDPEDTSVSALYRRWRGNIVQLWSPTRHASGFVIDQRGLIATSHRAIGDTTQVEVQVSDNLKVIGRVLFSDPVGDIALVHVNPSVLAVDAPLLPDCAAGPAMPLRDEQEVTTISIPLRGSLDIIYGEVRRVSSRLVGAYFEARRTDPGGPVFTVDGVMTGVTSVAGPDNAEDLMGDTPIVSPDNLCAALETALPELATAIPPPDTRLPVGPDVLTPVQPLADAAAGRLNEFEPYSQSSSDFDVQFITPIHVYGALVRAGRPTIDFSNWIEYVQDFPHMLLIRVTPQESESFVSKVLRGAVRFQGGSLPPITHFGPGFGRLRAFCGDTEVRPVHSFRLEMRTTQSEGTYEGLVAFPPDSLGSHCGTVRLLLYSEAEPDDEDALIVAPEVWSWVERDFAQLRDSGRQ